MPQSAAFRWGASCGALVLLASAVLGACTFVSGSDDLTGDPRPRFIACGTTQCNVGRDDGACCMPLAGGTPTCAAPCPANNAVLRCTSQADCAGQGTCCLSTRSVTYYSKGNGQVVERSLRRVAECLPVCPPADELDGGSDAGATCTPPQLGGAASGCPAGQSCVAATDVPTVSLCR